MCHCQYQSINQNWLKFKSKRKQRTVGPNTSFFYFTDLGSLIGITQCGNFRTFLPLKFYVKSILVILKPPDWLRFQPKISDILQLKLTEPPTNMRNDFATLGLLTPWGMGRHPRDNCPMKAISKIFRVTTICFSRGEQSIR